MIEIAEALSKGFKYVRVDLYATGPDSIKSGEMTFTPASGFMTWIPDKYDKIWGDLLKIGES